VKQREILVVDVATLGLAVHFGTVRPFVGGVGAGVFLRVGGRGAGSGQKQGRAGGQQQGVGAQAFHTAKVRPGGLKPKAKPAYFALDSHFYAALRVIVYTTLLSTFLFTALHWLSNSQLLSA
jgi:hypothetical protein